MQPIPSKVVVGEKEAFEHSAQEQHEHQYHEQQWRDN